MKADGGLTTQRMVELGRVSRSSFYRFDPGAKPAADRDMDLRDAIQHIALEWPCYGRPRITEELRRQGWTVNPKRVYRLMREDNLLCVRRRKFVVTTDSNHGRRIYPNLARELVLSGVNQLWIADLTYIRLREEFVFLAAILDAFSRRVIGWALDRTLNDELTLTALRMALAQRAPLPGLVHHSDRGSQYASGDYTALLKPTSSHQHVAQGKPLGQRRLRVVHEDAEVRRGLPQRVSRSGRGPRLDRRVPGKDLQPETPALGAGLRAARRVRSTTGGANCGGRCAATFFMSFLRHGESIDPMSGGNALGAGLLTCPQRSSASMSFSWLFLGGLVSTRARLRFTNRGQCAVNSVCRSSILQRTAKLSLNCLSHPRGQAHSLGMGFGLSHSVKHYSHNPACATFGKSVHRSCNGQRFVGRYGSGLHWSGLRSSSFTKVHRCSTHASVGAANERGAARTSGDGRARSRRGRGSTEGNWSPISDFWYVIKRRVESAKAS